MTRTLTPIPPLSIPEAVSALRGEAEVCSDEPWAPGLQPARVFPGVLAWRVSVAPVGAPEASQDVAYALFVPEEYIERGMDENARSGRGSLVTQAVGSPVLDVRDVDSAHPFDVARAIRRALPVTADEHALGYHTAPAAPDLDCQHAECIARLTGRPTAGSES